MKIYKLNIDTSKPVNQVMQMQQNTTGVLSVAISNNGQYIRNLSCSMYDGSSEISAISEGDNSFGFKVDVGAEPKHVKAVAKSTPIESIKEYIASYTPGTRPINKFVKRIVIPAGTYRQDEFESLKQFGSYSGMLVILIPATNNEGKANFDRISINLFNPQQQLWFGKLENNEIKWLSPDEPLVVTEEVAFGGLTAVKTTNANTIVISSDTYPAIGYYTDYQMDTLVKPSVNAYYEGEYTEPLKEVEVDGVKFVPTTLSVDGVEYKVLAEAQA
jgi:hypothetical protein